MENYNTIIEGVVKVPLGDTRNEEFCTKKAKERKLFLKGIRFVMCFEEFTITDIRREDLRNGIIIILPSSKPCREL